LVVTVDESRYTDEEDRPWELPGGVRRDCAPHRGNWLMLLAVVSMVCTSLSFLFAVPGLVGFFFGLLTAALAERDLSRMATGSMDPQGKGQATNARRLALMAMSLSVVGAVTCCLFNPLGRMLFDYFGRMLFDYF
jgi:hypothetical protein